MARQETELKRLSAEIQQELQLMQRRAADVVQGRWGGLRPARRNSKR